MQKSVHSSDYRRLRAELRRLRESAGLSQRELAGKLDVAHSWVAKVENGERRIDLIEFAWVAQACSADPVESFARILRIGHPPKGGRKK
jgi:transcriptional regulator with XRE-family HTH domain